MEAAWLMQRQRVQDATGEPCHQARRFEEHGERARGVRICPNQRLYSCYMWTDDPIFIVDGAERAVRALRLWRALTLSVRLIMAAAIKRSLGAWTLWLGIILIPALGLLVVPRDKILRASASISAVLSDGANFHVYRALCGLLEFLRAVNLRGRNIMHGLYAPHQPDGASRFGPSGRVVCDDLMRKQLERWLSLLASSCVTNVKKAISRGELELKPSLFFHLCSDAMYEDAEAGLGGFCHGLFWTFEVPADHLPDLSIPILEFLGVCFNILVFFPRLRRLLDANPNAAIVLRTDSLTAALTLPAESQRSALLVACGGQEVDLSKQGLLRYVQTGLQRKLPETSPRYEQGRRQCILRMLASANHDQLGQRRRGRHGLEWNAWLRGTQAAGSPVYEITVTL